MARDKMKRVTFINKIGCIMAYIVYAILSITVIGLIITIPGFIKTSKFKSTGHSKIFSGIWGILFAGILPGILILI